MLNKLATVLNQVPDVDYSPSDSSGNLYLLKLPDSKLGQSLVLTQLSSAGQTYVMNERASVENRTAMLYFYNVDLAQAWKLANEVYNWIMDNRYSKLWRKNGLMNPRIEPPLYVAENPNKLHVLAMEINLNYTHK